MNTLKIALVLLLLSSACQAQQAPDSADCAARLEKFVDPMDGKTSRSFRAMLDVGCGIWITLGGANAFAEVTDNAAAAGGRLRGVGYTSEVWLKFENDSLVKLRHVGRINVKGNFFVEVDTALRARLMQSRLVLVRCYYSGGVDNFTVNEANGLRVMQGARCLFSPR
jgi:hypothetical protein